MLEDTLDRYLYKSHINPTWRICISWGLFSSEDESTAGALQDGVLVKINMCIISIEILRATVCLDEAGTQYIEVVVPHMNIYKSPPLTLHLLDDFSYSEPKQHIFIANRLVCLSTNTQNNINLTLCN